MIAIIAESFKNNLKKSQITDSLYIDENVKELIHKIKTG